MQPQIFSFFKLLKSGFSCFDIEKVETTLCEIELCKKITCVADVMRQSLQNLFNMMNILKETFSNVFFIQNKNYWFNKLKKKP